MTIVRSRPLPVRVRVGVLEYALSLARDLAHSWPRGPHQYYLCATPPSDMIFFRTLYYDTTYRLNKYTRSSADMSSRHGMKYPYFVSLSVTTNTESYSSVVPGSFDFGSLTMKSIAMSCHAPVGAEFGWSFP